MRAPDPQRLGDAAANLSTSSCAAASPICARRRRLVDDARGRRTQVGDAAADDDVEEVGRGVAEALRVGRAHGGQCRTAGAGAKASSSVLRRSGSSTCGQCPHPSSSTCSTAGSAARTWRAPAGGTMRSRSPQTSRTGTRTSSRRNGSSSSASSRRPVLEHAQDGVAVAVVRGEGGDGVAARFARPRERELAVDLADDRANRGLG